MSRKIFQFKNLNQVNVKGVLTITVFCNKFEIGFQKKIMEARMICKACERNEVHVQKWELCKKCYMKWWQTWKAQPEGAKPGFYKPESTRPTKVKELEFLRNFFTHNKWLYEPVTFKLRSGSYTPDFYDQVRNTFIEVVGSRQAYHQNKDKYDELVNLFPDLLFEIRTPDGNFLNNDEPSWKESGAWPEYGVTSK